MCCCSCLPPGPCPHLSNHNPNPVSPLLQALGLNTTTFDRHVILETNNATERVFPEVRAAPAVVATCSTRCGRVAGRRCCCECLPCDLLLRPPSCRPRRSPLVWCSPLQRCLPLLSNRCPTLRPPASGTAWTAWWATTPRCARFPWVTIWHQSVPAAAPKLLRLVRAMPGAEPAPHAWCSQPSQPTPLTIIPTPTNPFCLAAGGD